MAETIFPQIPEPSASFVASSPPDLGCELAFDFERGEFIMENGAPKVVEGIEALKVWIEKALRTARYRFLAYSHNYGCELEQFIESQPPLPLPVVQSEVERIIREALIYDDRISELKDFKVERDSDWLDIEFTVVTILGERFSQEVTWNV